MFNFTAARLTTFSRPKAQSKIFIFLQSSPERLLYITAIIGFNAVGGSIGMSRAMSAKVRGRGGETMGSNGLTAALPLRIHVR